MIEEVLNYLKENLYIVISAGMMLLAAVIIIIMVVSGKRQKKKNTDFYGEYSSSYQKDKVVLPNSKMYREQQSDDYSGVTEGTLDEFGTDDEKTVAESLLVDNEKTVDELSSQRGNQDKHSVQTGIPLIFHITYAGHTRMITRTLEHLLVLGRGDKSDIDVVFGQQDMQAKLTSRQHVILVKNPDGIYVQDNNSHNKTLLNGELLTGQKPLNNGDVLRMGEAIVQIMIDPKMQM